MLDARLCEEYLKEVRAFAESIGLADQLQKKLDDLSRYGYHPDDTDPRGRVEPTCVLYRDFAPHSFAFEVRRPRPGDEGQDTMLVGGLIYQGPDSPADGSFPSLTVSLAEGVGWFIHT